MRSTNAVETAKSRAMQRAYETSACDVP
jgi:hypothetical protein